MRMNFRITDGLTFSRERLTEIEVKEEGSLVVK